LSVNSGVAGRFRSEKRPAFVESVDSLASATFHWRAK